MALAACLGPGGRTRSTPAPLYTDPAPRTVFLWPLRSFRVLSPFGPRGRKFHTGVDLLQTRGGGDPVYSSAAGKVVWAGSKGRYGRSVVVLHGDGYRTRYAHLKKIYVKTGDPVAAGDKIGTVGRTGRATTAHLHFEIIAPSGRFLNPGPRLKKP